MNPFRDDPIIKARRAVSEAQAALAERPSPKAALAVQRAQQKWAALRRLEVA